MTFRWFRAAIWLICVTRLFAPSIDAGLVIFTPMYVAPVLMSGVALLCLGFSIALVSHQQLGQAWRSGIDPSGPKSLQQSGLYRFSRNPMYIGVMTAQLGFFLALPSLFTLVCLIIGVSALVRQVNAEEDHLRETLPTEYKDYSAHVPRWLIG